MSEQSPAAGATAEPASGSDGPVKSVLVDFDLPFRMRDGVVLRSDVYRPAGDGPWPTLVVRTPYGKGVMSEAMWNGISPVEAARSGFMVVIQDVRGRFASEGEWEPLVHERRDGADTIGLAAALPGSNGRVGMFGGSYCGATQWQAALEQPPALAAITPLITWSEPLDGLVSRGGALELSLCVSWSLVQGFDWLFRQGLAEDEAMARAGAMIEDIDRLAQDGYWGLPVSELPVLERHRTPGLIDLRAATDREATQAMRVAGEHSRVQVPTLHTSGWFDVFCQGTLDNFMAMRARGREAKLIAGPWTHMDMQDPIGEREFGVAAMREAPVHPHGDWSGEVLAFLARHLREAEPADDDTAAVRLFVMGRNEWRDEQSWPLPRAQPERWNVHTDGTLSTSALEEHAEVSEVAYNPADPVPTHGGAHLLASHPRGSVDQTRIEARDDVLVFTSAPLEQDVEVTGRVRAILHVESSAPSADWVARLCDVMPDGRSYNLCDGVVRINDGANECRQIEVDLWSTSNVFLTGHRIRLQIANSCFPRWDRNLSTGDQRSTEFTIARQRLHHDAHHPSYVELPIVPA